MKRIRFIIDSTFGMSPEYLDKYQILINPLNVIVDGLSYLDGVEIQVRDVMEYVAQGKKVTTSQPSPGSYKLLYDQAFKEGADYVICLTISSLLSGTVQSANAAREMHERAEDIFVHDTLGVNIEAAMLLETGIEAMEQGKHPTEIIEIIKKNKPDSGVLLNLVTLDNLLYSGRVSWMKAFIGNLLHVKPVVLYKDAKVMILKKFRSEKKVYHYFVDYCQSLRKKHQGRMRLRLSHVNAIERVNRLYDELSKALPDVKIEMGMEITPLMAIYIAYGGIAVAWIFERD